MINSYVKGFAASLLCLAMIAPSHAAGQSRDSMIQRQQSMGESMNMRQFDQNATQLKIERERAEAEMALKKKNAAAAAEAAKAAEAAEAAKAAAPVDAPAMPPKG